MGKKRDYKVTPKRQNGRREKLEGGERSGTGKRTIDRRYRIDSVYNKKIEEMRTV